VRATIAATPETARATALSTTVQVWVALSSWETATVAVEVANHL
jgi:hypothetical protein